MSIARVDRRCGPAFTLLEVTLAVAILGMMALAIYRFVSTNVTAVRLSTEINETDARYEGLANLLIQQLQALTPGQGALAGEPYKFSGRSRDSLCGRRILRHAASAADRWKRQDGAGNRAGIGR